MQEQPVSALHFKKVRDTDLKIVGGIITILGMAAIFFLQKYFVTLDRYERDQVIVHEMAADIKQLLKQSH